MGHLFFLSSSLRSKKVCISIYCYVNWFPKRLAKSVSRALDALHFSKAGHLKETCNMDID